MTNIVEAAATLTNLPPSTVQDISKVLGDFGVSLSPTDVIQFLVGVFVIARLLRKAVPDNWQNGIVGTALKHAALEVNPDVPKTTVTLTATGSLPATVTTTASGNGPTTH